MANLLFSVLCTLGLVTIKAAVLIFSSRIVLAFFSHGLSAEKEKQICYLQSYSAPTTGRGGGRLARRPGGESHIASKNRLTVLNSLFGGSTCFDNKKPFLVKTSKVLRLNCTEGREGGSSPCLSLPALNLPLLSSPLPRWPQCVGPRSGSTDTEGLFFSQT